MLVGQGHPTSSPFPAAPPARRLLLSSAIRDIGKLQRHAVEATINRLLFITGLLILVDLVTCSHNEQCLKKDRELRATILRREYVETLSQAPHRRPLLCQNIIRHCLHRT
jgi:hypothetical protein